MTAELKRTLWFVGALAAFAIRFVRRLADKLADAFVIEQHQVALGAEVNGNPGTMNQRLRMFNFDLLPAYQLDGEGSKWCPPNHGAQ